MSELKKLRISEKKIEVLDRMGIHDSMDLLTYYPFRYEQHVEVDRSLWEKDTKVAIEVTILTRATVARFGGKRSMTRMKVLYNDEELQLSIFNRPWVSAFVVGNTMSVFGKFDGKNTIVVSTYNNRPLKDQLGIEPVYNIKDGVTQNDIKKYIDKALDLHVEELEDFVPESFLKKYQLIHKKDAILYAHHPKTYELLRQSLRHLKYEEFLKFQLVMAKKHQEEKKEVEHGAKQFQFDDVMKLKQTLPFELTIDQEESILEILQDLQRDSLMYRMLQGDVGSGKTLVAAFGMYATTLAHKQAALLAPTEILVKQHYQTLCELFEGFDIRIGMLYSSQSTQDRKQVLQDLKEHNIDMIVGTHALFQEEVTYYDLGFVVADEQHRFGVRQRKMMLSKGEKVDFLLMSATPIPRTLAISLFGDMDVSTIKTLPKGKKEIITKLIRSSSMSVILEDVLHLVDEGNQCYVVCPAIEKNEDMPMRNVNDIYQGMKQSLGKKYTIGLLHGKMSAEEKDEVMEAFLRKEIQFLVSTTVIEVGVSVKSANIMVIYDAHRFGMAQIHQLRGRVGRGSAQGYCYLLTPTKDEDALNRLRTCEKIQDGFELSRQDLMLRGPGDVLGERQSGIPSFVLGDVIQDSKILELSKEDALTILENVDKDEYRVAKKYLENNEATRYYD